MGSLNFEWTCKFVGITSIWTAILADVWTLKSFAKEAKCWCLSFPLAIVNSSIQFVPYSCGDRTKPQVQKALSPMAAWKHFSSLCLSSHQHHVSPFKPWSWHSYDLQPHLLGISVWHDPAQAKPLGHIKASRLKILVGHLPVSSKWGQKTGFCPLDLQKAI